MPNVVISLFFVLVYFINQKQDNIQLIENFLNSTSDGTIDSNAISKYFPPDLEFPTNEEVYDVVLMNLKSIHQRLSSCSTSYDIVHHNDKEADFYSDYDFRYEKLDEVYHVVCSKEIITSFIVNEDKITSFFTYLRKTKKQEVIPFILSKYPDE